MVTVQPKSYVGSSGSLHASNLVKIRNTHPDLFELPNPENPRQHEPVVYKVAAYIEDTINYYIHTTNEADVKSVTKKQDCVFRRYELDRIETLQNRLQSVSSEHMLPGTINNLTVQQISSDVEQLITEANDLIICLKEYSSSKAHVWSKCQKVISCAKDNVLHFLEGLNLPKLRPCVIEFTDAGPGVGVSNHEVQYREVELARLHKSVLRHRVHLASDDQGQNEAERTNAYIGMYLFTSLFILYTVITMCLSL